MGDALPAERLDLLIDGLGDDRREIRVRAGSPALARYVDAAAAFRKEP